MQLSFLATALFVLAVSMPGCENCDKLRSPISPGGESSNGQTEVWFTPNLASRDMLKLFSSPMEWFRARSHIDVFKFYVQQIVGECRDCGDNTFTNLARAGNEGAFRWLNLNNVRIGIEAGAIKDWNCGREPADAVSIVLQAIENVHRTGGKVSYIAMDEPYVSVREWCKQSTDTASDHVAYFVKEVNRRYPGVAIGLVEPYPSFSVKEIKSFISNLENHGVKLPFFHLDMHREGALANNNISRNLRELESFCRERSISFGVIIWGDNGLSNQQYFNGAMFTAQTVRAAIGAPDHIIFQSWSESAVGDRMFPDNLPEDSPMTLTWIVNEILSYFGI